MKSIKALYTLSIIILKKLISRIDNKYILFVPHSNCKNDNYDIINFRSDNVLCLFNSILRDPKYNDFHLCIAYFDESKIDDYKRYCDQYNLSRIHFLPYYNLIVFYTYFYKCRFVFTDEIYRNYKFKSNKQKVICLNYYPFPYKSDYVKLFDKSTNKYSYLNEQIRINKYYDYLVSTSDLSSIAISQAEPFYYEKCVTLGFPRSDIFYMDNSLLRERVIRLFPYEVKKIFIYVPTHRDYEDESRKAYDGNNKRRSIWGYQSEDSIKKLETLLQNEKCVIIAKIHPVQAREILDEQKTERIFTYHEITSRLLISLNELMVISDAMITDYTSAVFDYLMCNKPIIYYYFDIEKYNEARGFFINPMTPLCAGDTCFNLSELTASLKNIIDGNDSFGDKRKFLLDLIVTHQDANSTERIKKYFLE